MSDAILPFVAIIIAGVLAALIARGMGRRLLVLQARESKSAVVTVLISAARNASVWNTLGLDQRAHTDSMADEASVRLRLLAEPGASLAADWFDHEFAAIKDHSVTFSFQAEQSYADVRERIIEWQAKPTRARKLFRSDLDRWKAELESTRASSPAHARADEAHDAEAQSTSGQPSWAVTTPTTAAHAPITPSPARFSPPAATTASSAGEPTVAISPADAPRFAPAKAVSAPKGEAAASATSTSPTPAKADAPTDNHVPQHEAPSATTDAPAATPPKTDETTGSADETKGDVPGDTTVRRPTGMVSTPVVAPAHHVTPAAPVGEAAAAAPNTADDADSDQAETDSHEAPYSAPLRAQQVRRRTSPES